jgi:hypothetical protein
MTSPTALRQLAIETGSCYVRGDLTVTPEGLFVLKGRKATLNEAIIYLGGLSLREQAAA